MEEAIAVADSSTLADVAWLRLFFRAAGGAAIESPPRGLRDTLTTTFEAHRSNRQTTGFVKRVLGGLTFDSFLQPAAGLRAVGARRSRRQLVYNAETFDLAVNLLARETDNHLDIDGQVLSRKEEDHELFSVQLLRDGEELALTTIDELGSFSLQGVPSGSYEMVLVADRLEISIVPFDVSL